MVKVSIIIPAYNEEKRISRTLDEYLRYFEDLYKQNILDYEILIVINNTTDKTEEIVKKYANKNPRLRYINLKQKGKGFATTQGFKDSLNRDNDLVGFVDADLATGPGEYYKLIRNISRHDGAIADRYLRGSKVFPPTTFRRSVVSKVFNFVVRSLFLFSYKDTQCGAKLFKREVIEKILPRLGMAGWAFDVEILYLCRKNKFRIAPTPTIWYDVGKAKLKVGKASIQMFFSVLQLRLMNSPFKRLLRPLSRFTGFFWEMTQ